jgi:hypothetical protein
MSSCLKGSKKAPYGKPTVSRVPLRPEEAVLTACKVSGIQGPSSSQLNCIVGTTRCNINSPT